MLLSDRDILAEIEGGHVGISPLNRCLIQPASIDLQLSPDFLLFPSALTIDPADDPPPMCPARIADDARLVLPAGGFALGSTVETVRLPDYIAGRVEGKSTLGRIGLQAHSTAGWIDPGFTGTITLELHNVNSAPVALRPGMLIGQLCLFRLSSPAISPYGSAARPGRYMGQRGPTAARVPVLRS
jgi:dCTP deaminase